MQASRPLISTLATLRTADHQDEPFFLVDKARATLSVFDRHARLHSSMPALLGAATGDVSVPGIGDPRWR